MYAGEDQARHDGFVAVPAHQQAAVAAGHRHHRGFHRRGAAAGGKPCDVGPHRVGHQVLGVFEVPVTGPAIVQPAAGQHVVGERLVAQYGQHPVVGAAALPVPGRSESIPVLLPVVGQGVEQWSVGLVHWAGVPGRSVGSPARWRRPGGRRVGTGVPPHRRLFGRPAADGLQLGSQRDQHALAVCWPHQLHADRQTF